MNRIVLSTGYFPDPTIGRPVSNGDIYVGDVDTDPEIVGNQKSISVLQEDGSTVSVTQPISTGAGGVPLYAGSPVTVLVDGDYSLKVLDSTGAQVYYIPSNTDADTASAISFWDVSETYSKGDRVRDTDTNVDYFSLTDLNIGNTPDGDGTHWQRENILAYNATLNYISDLDTVVGSDGYEYRCLIDNGPDSSTVNPVGDATGTWVKVRQLGNILTYSSKINYPVNVQVLGSNDVLYFSTIANGPDSTVVDPVGDATGTWSKVTIGIQKFTSTGTYTKPSNLYYIQVDVQAGGGGAGGIEGTGAGEVSVSTGGGGGGYATKIIDADDVVATESIVVGAGGAGGAAGVNDGAAGGTSSFGSIISCTGGDGGNSDAASSNVNINGSPGGEGTGGDINIDGSASGDADGSSGSRSGSLGIS